MSIHEALKISVTVLLLSLRGTGFQRQGCVEILIVPIEYKYDCRMGRPDLMFELLKASFAVFFFLHHKNTISLQTLYK